jgi:DNA-binding NarL/FixJ family response regulator
MHEGPHYVRSSLEAGARGCLSKRDIGEALLNAIRSLLVAGAFDRYSCRRRSQCQFFGVNQSLTAPKP